MSPIRDSHVTIGGIMSLRSFPIDHVCEPRFVLDIRLHPHGAGTRVVWLADFENKAFAKSMQAFLETANEQKLDRLAGELGRR